MRPAYEVARDRGRTLASVTPRGPAPAHDSVADVVRAHIPMIVIGATAFVAFDGIAAARGDASALSYAAIMAILFVTVAVADRWVGFTTPLLWCLVTWAVLHMAGGLISTGTNRVLYNESLGIPGIHFDRVVHAFGFGTATVACWQALRRYPPAPVPTVGLVVLAALAGLGLGALNETAEFLMTRLSSTTSIGGYRNTGFDLISNTIGAAIAAVWLYWRGHERVDRAARSAVR
jgi:Predicted membrane protein (DUF2238)